MVEQWARVLAGACPVRVASWEVGAAWAGACVYAGIAPLERKNGWTLAEWAGDRLPVGMQRLLGEADWDADAVRDDVRDYVVGTIGDKDGVLIGDDTGFLKKGVRSAGAQRQPVLGRLRTRTRAVPGQRGLSSATVTRLTKRWTAEDAYFQSRDLAGSGCVCGVGRRHPPQDRACWS